MGNTSDQSEFELTADDLAKVRGFVINLGSSSFVLTLAAAVSEHFGTQSAYQTQLTKAIEQVAAVCGLQNIRTVGRASTPQHVVNAAPEFALLVNLAKSQVTARPLSYQLPTGSLPSDELVEKCLAHHHELVLEASQAEDQCGRQD